MEPSKRRALNYLSRVPIALGMERLAEAHLYDEESLDRPILDLGCGDGLFAELAFSKPLDFGLDPDPSELRVAGRISSPYIELVQATGSRMPFQDCSIGSVISNSVLEHIYDLRPVVREVRRVLKPGGQFVVTVPSHRFEQSGVVATVLGALKMRRMLSLWSRRYNKFWKHFHAYDIVGWRDYFEQEGFDVASSFYYHPVRSCLRNDLLTPFGAIGKAQKLLFNKWTFFASIRRMMLILWWPILKKLAGRDSMAIESGGLVCVVARKPG